MRPLPPSRARLAAGLAAAALLGTACGVSAGPQGQAAASSSDGAVLPGPGDAALSPLTVHLVAAEGGAEGFEGHAFGCGDLLVAVQTVPAGSADPAATALDFLFEDVQGEHGDPVLTNAVAATADTLGYDGHHRSGDTEVFSFSGAVAAEGACTVERIRAQLQETARAQTDAAQVRLEVDGRPLDEVLGLDPLTLGGPTGTSGDSASASSSPSPSAAPTTTAPAPVAATAAPDPVASARSRTWSPTSTPTPTAAQPTEAASDTSGGVSLREGRSSAWASSGGAGDE